MLKTCHGSCHRGARVFDVGNETPIGRMYGVNLGCLTDVPDEELAQLPVTYVDDSAGTRAATFPQGCPDNLSVGF